MKYPFEVDFQEIKAHIDDYVSTVFSSLGSEFLTLPKGDGFVEYPVFERGYEALKRNTREFQELVPATIVAAVTESPMAVIVLRTILGFTPPEWAFTASEQTGVNVSQGFVRTMDRMIRMGRFNPTRLTPTVAERFWALIDTACALLENPPSDVAHDQLHRLDKADTSAGKDSVRTAAQLGVPYAMLLYERFLGRPFAGHRDSVSELIGDVVESAIERFLAQAGISYRKTKRAERIPGFDQAPDFIIPDEFTPEVVIEAKLSEDDGTARDKMTRIQHLAEISARAGKQGKPGFEVVACIAGRGFGVRRQLMKSLLLATQGKVFTLRTLDRLVECTRLRDFRTR